MRSDLLIRTRLYLAIVLALPGCAEEQKPLDCAPCRIGRFRDTLLPDYIITRTRTTQHEERGEHDHVSVSKFIWIDGCTYAITDARTIRGRPYPIAPTDTLKVTITGVDTEGCEYIAVMISSNPELDGTEVSGRQEFLKR